MFNTECVHFAGPDGDGCRCTLHGMIAKPAPFGIDLSGVTGCSGCPDAKPLEFPEFELACGMTHTPTGDRIELFNRSRSGLRAAGLWGERILISCDPLGRLGPFGNFYLLATSMFLRWPNATAYLIAQDDLQVHPEARAAVQSAWRHGQRHWAVLSLYTPPEIAERNQPVSGNEAGWYVDRAGWDSPGACCYVFSDWGLRSLLTDPVVLWHRRRGPTGGFRGTDSVVGAWAAEHGGIWHWAGPEPLVRHIGQVSTIDRGNP